MRHVPADEVVGVEDCGEVIVEFLGEGLFSFRDLKKRNGLVWLGLIG